jgi:hypothetical protein
MSAKHSPGPWLPCRVNDSACICGLIWSQPSDAPVCEVSSGGEDGEWPPETRAANQRLIAAAPEMLALLRRQDYRALGCKCEICDLLAHIDGETSRSDRKTTEGKEGTE